MKVSQAVEWGLHCAILLAQVPGDSPLRREVLARHYDLPEAYLSKTLQAMTRAGVLQATPGPRGGYRLAGPAERLTALEVVEAVEGTAEPFTCQEIRQRGLAAATPEECKRPCTVNSLMFQAHQAWRETLRTVTIADLVSRVPHSIRARNRRLLAG
ncbi:RrF2 family transcriptional regulator [Streptomyces spiralis]